MQQMKSHFGGKFKLVAKIQQGSYGQIFKAQNIQTEEQVAIKLEPLNQRYPQLKHEIQILKQLQGGVGIPKLHYYGQESEYIYMVMDLLGPNLETLFLQCGGKFSIVTVCKLALQMISRLQCIHSKHIVHRDIKPENFLIGINKKSQQLHLIDYGSSKKFRDPKSGIHVSFKENKSLIGTARFASINNHLGYEKSARDDLESLGYCFVYFLKRKLPWQGQTSLSKKDNYDQILEMKRSIALEILCENIPEEFYIFMNYSRNLQFQQTPDYDYLKKLFQNLLFKGPNDWTQDFEWNNEDFVRSNKLDLNPILIQKIGQRVTSKNEILDKSKDQLGQNQSKLDQIPKNLQGQL